MFQSFKKTVSNYILNCFNLLEVFSYVKIFIKSNFLDGFVFRHRINLSLFFKIVFVIGTSYLPHKSAIIATEPLVGPVIYQASNPCFLQWSLNVHVHRPCGP